MNEKDFANKIWKERQKEIDDLKNKNTILSWGIINGKYRNLSDDLKKSTDEMLEILISENSSQQEFDSALDTLISIFFDNKKIPD